MGKARAKVVEQRCKRVLIVKGKCGDSVYDATTDEQLHKIALQLLRSRFDGHNGLYRGALGPPPKPPAVSKDDGNKLPSEVLRRACADEWKGYRHAQNAYENLKSFYEEIDHALEHDDGKLAVRLLEQRSRYEYEEIDLIDVQPEYRG